MAGGEWRPCFFSNGLGKSLLHRHWPASTIDMRGMFGCKRDAKQHILNAKWLWAVASVAEMVPLQVARFFLWFRWRHGRSEAEVLGTVFFSPLYSTPWRLQFQHIIVMRPRCAGASLMHGSRPRGLWVSPKPYSLIKFHHPRVIKNDKYNIININYREG